MGVEILSLLAFAGRPAARLRPAPRAAEDGATLAGGAAGLLVHLLNALVWAMVLTVFTAFVSASAPALPASVVVAISFLAAQIVLRPLWTLAALTVASVFYVLFGGAKA